MANLIQANRLSPQGTILPSQPQLTVGAANDRYEKEADNIAQRVVSVSDSALRLHQASDRDLTAHELTHVLQQGGMPEPAQRKIDGNENAQSERINRKPDEDHLPPVPKLNPSTELQIPGMTDQQLAKLREDIKDPDQKKFEAEQKTEEATRAAKEKEEDATRYDRFMALKEVIIPETHYSYNVKEISDFLFKNFSPKDIQILRRFGLSGNLGVEHRNSAANNLLDAINAYQADRKTNTMSSPSRLSPAGIKERQVRAKVMEMLDVVGLMDSGVFAAAGGAIGGKKGAEAGAIVDDMVQGAGSLAEGGGNARGGSTSDRDPIIDEPMRPEPPAPTPDPASGHDPTPATESGSPSPGKNQPTIDTPPSPAKPTEMGVGGGGGAGEGGAPAYNGPSLRMLSPGETPPPGIPTLTRRQATLIGELRAGHDVIVPNLETAQALLKNMPDIRPLDTTGRFPWEEAPRGTYRGDLAYTKVTESTPVPTEEPYVHAPGTSAATHSRNTHYNIVFPNGRKAAILVVR